MGTDRAVAERRFDTIEPSLRESANIEITVCLATLNPDEGVDEVMARADAELYSRRRASR